MPSAKVFTFSEISNPAAEFRIRLSLMGPVSPSKTLLIMNAFSSADPPLRSSSLLYLKPNSFGSRIFFFLTTPFLISIIKFFEVVVNSS